MFVAISNRIPAVLVLDSTRAQANARAGWNARHYGVSTQVVDAHVARTITYCECWDCLGRPTDCERCYYGADCRKHDAEEAGIAAAEANAEGLYGQ